MSGATDRKEEELVPQFYGRIDEKFAEWETDVKLWHTVHNGQYHPMPQRQWSWITSRGAWTRGTG